MNRKSGECLASSLAIAMGLAAAPAFSQSAGNGAGAANGATDSTSLQEIVVTAQKRTENLQKAPIAVDTASNDALTRAGAERLDNIEKVMPDVKISAGGSGEFIGIRGVYSTDNSPTAEQANAVNLDGAYIAKARAIDGQLYDIQRVEVAKGPQGTLYGRNTNGGAINIITNKPVIGEDEADASIEYGSYSLLRTEGAAGVTLSDSVAMRAAFQTLSHNGYLRSGLDDQDEKSGRLSFLWKPDETQSLLLTADMVRVGGRGAGDSVVGSEPATSNAGGTNTANYYIPPNPRDDTFYTTMLDANGNRAPSGLGQLYRVDNQNNGLMLQYDYNFDWATWTSQADWRKFNSNLWAIANIGSGPVDPTTGYPTAGYGYEPQHFNSQSLESRLTSNNNRQLQWVGGVYAFHETDGGTNINYDSLVTTTPSIQIANGSQSAKSFAGFGQAVFTPESLDALHITAGARYTYDQKYSTGIFTQFGTSTVPGFLTSEPDFEKSWSAVTYKFGLSYDLTDRNMVYANISTGYKAGGFAYGPGTTSAGPVYAPEKIKAYEVGSKNRFLNDSLQVNLEAWYYKYTDYQTNLFMYGVDKIPLPVLTVASAGEATYQGATIDTEYRITAADMVRFDLTAISAVYGNFVIPTPAGYSASPCPAGCTPGAVLEDLSHTDIYGVPHLSGNASYNHTWTLPRGSLSWEGDSIFHGNTLLDLEQDGIYGRVRMEQRSFFMWDTSLRYDASDSKWNVTAYVHNLTNGLHYRTGAYSANTHLFTATFYDPRVVGITFQYKFKPGL